MALKDSGRFMIAQKTRPFQRDTFEWKGCLSVKLSFVSR